MKQKLFENIGGNMFKLREDEHDRIDPDQRWDKVPQHPETNAADPSEAEEVRIAKRILKAISAIDSGSVLDDPNKINSVLSFVAAMAQEIIALHKH